MSLPNTAIYAGINVLIMLALGFQVVRQRWATRTNVGDGGHKLMKKAMRAHGNNTENVPAALLIIGLLESVAAPLILVHILGVSLTLGRLSHAIGINRTLGTSKPRVLGMCLTWIVFLFGGLACIYYGWLAR